MNYSIISNSFHIDTITLSVSSIAEQESAKTFNTMLRMNWSNNLSKKLRNSYNAMKRLLREINI
jgi:hypothetical protein